MTSSNPSKYIVDGVAVDGLLGAYNSLSYRVHEIEKHLHSRERWLGAAAVPNAEIHVADSILTSPNPFSIAPGNNAWGAWVQILGSSDTPVISGMLYFDPHEWMPINSTHNDATYLIQIAAGASGAQGLADGAYTERVLQTTGNKVGESPNLIQTRRQVAGTKVWVRCWCRGQNAGTFTFYFGIHEYEG